MKILKRSVFYFLVALFIWTIFIFYVRDKYTVPILMYHQVQQKRMKGDLNTVSQKSFDWQMKFLRKHGYQVISVEDLVQGIARGVQFARNTVVITFDDGYADNYFIAFPALKKYGFPATLFMVSSFVGRPGYLTWSQLMEMHNSRITVASHTRTHQYLPNLNKEQLFDEIVNSKKELEAGLKVPVKFFSYPSGGYSEEIKEMVIQANYEGACATNRGYDRFQTSTFELKRIRVNDEDNTVVLWAKLSGYYNLFREFKSTH
ncbi:MAG: polysaccharide deacetylase family protein [Candidatus Omnitrophica bacterium]|nr:polysaccharide deacetylase family protein [Candidatus Omnitrophota bacterium]